MQGKLYGIGVGPGDPELLTLKAVRLIEQCEVIAIPISSTEGRVAVDIVRQAVPQIAQKQLLELSMPMTRDKAVLQQSHDGAAAAVIEQLEQGKDVCFLTIGDPSIYSTYGYIHTRVVAKGYTAEMIPGVPSFCAVAARLGVMLGQGAEDIHILAASYDGLDQGLDYSGTKVLMKAGKSLAGLQEKLAERNLLSQAGMVERCGMADEKVWSDLHQLDQQANYLSTVIVTQREARQ